MPLVELHEYDTRWPELFAEQRVELERILQPWLSDGVHHIGSTAIPGISAKPVIDMMAGVASFDEAAAAIPVLVAAGWTTSSHRPRTHHFIKYDGQRATHALHLLESGHRLWSERLAFRDALRADEVLREEYERLKLEQAAQHPDDLGAYTQGKAAFVRRVLQASGLEYDDWRRA